jgi:hypothetical protein
MRFFRWGRILSLIFLLAIPTFAQHERGELRLKVRDPKDMADNSRFWVSQDQRNTAHGRLRFQASRRLWLATEAFFGSGLPVELDTGDTDYQFLLAQYGPRILNEVDFARGRVRPSYSLDASSGIDLYRKENKVLTLEVQISNLTNHLNVINFDSLFSGTAIDPPRSFEMRLKAGF